MDFARTFADIQTALERRGVRVSVIGGLARGRVEIVYVRDTTRDRVFAGVRMLPGPAGIAIPVASPEHLIAMKVHAIGNAPERLWQDMADIAFLVRLDGVDRDAVRCYFEKAGLGDKWRELASHL